MSELHQKQVFFARMVPRLIDKAFELGFEVVCGEIERDPTTALHNAQMGTGIAKSLHILSLAIDLKLFKDGVYLKDAEPYRPLAEFWESLSTPEHECCAGIHFQSIDADHFSVSYQGIK